MDQKMIVISAVFNTLERWLEGEGNPKKYKDESKRDVSDCCFWIVVKNEGMWSIVDFTELKDSILALALTLNIGTACMHSQWYQELHKTSSPPAWLR